MMSANARVINTKSSTSSRSFLTATASLRSSLHTHIPGNVHACIAITYIGTEWHMGVAAILSLINTRSLFTTHVSAITLISTGA